MSVPLLWKPLGDSWRLIFAVTSRSPRVPMGSDLARSLVTALELYGV